MVVVVALISSVVLYVLLVLHLEPYFTCYELVVFRALLAFFDYTTLYSSFRSPLWKYKKCSFITQQHAPAVPRRPRGIYCFCCRSQHPCAAMHVNNTVYNSTAHFR